MSTNKKVAKKNYNDRRNSKGKRRSKKEEVSKEEVTGMIPLKNGDRNPNWYFTDARLAEQTTQLAFQNLAGYPIEVAGQQFDVPNVVTIAMNPCPGVIKSADYGTTILNETSGINLAAFRLYTELSAFTGRSSTYAPSDIAMIILALGECISTMEFIRRAFGVAYTINMRNRSYPKTILEGMRIDPDDLFANYANYRTRYNTLVTMLNQLPIPAGIAYFDKCRALYQEIYLDSESSMAQTLIPVPYSTWLINEKTSTLGTRLTTVYVTQTPNGTDIYNAVRPLSYYLQIADRLISALLNASSLNIVYTDIINYYGKVGGTFMKLDYLYDGYAVVPRYSREFLLQMHNATLVGTPIAAKERVSSGGSVNVTAYNNVESEPNSSTIFYNPGFFVLGNLSGGFVRTGDEVLIDMLSDAPDLNDRVEFSRYTSIGGETRFAQNNNNYICDAVLPDHYVVGVHFWTPSGQLGNTNWFASSLLSPSSYVRVATFASAIANACRFFEVDTSVSPQVYTGNYVGELNYYTTVQPIWLRKVNQFIALGLYSLRK